MEEGTFQVNTVPGKLNPATEVSQILDWAENKRTDDVAAVKAARKRRRKLGKMMVSGEALVRLWENLVDTSVTED